MCRGKTGDWDEYRPGIERRDDHFPLLVFLLFAELALDEHHRAGLKLAHGFGTFAPDGHRDPGIVRLAIGAGLGSDELEAGAWAPGRGVLHGHAVLGDGA